MSVLVLVVSLVATQPALAQPDTRAESDAAFRRGLELYEEQRDDAALAEFANAWRLSPRPEIAYNIGRVHDRLGHPVESIDWYERFLATAEATTRTMRRLRDQVTRDLERLRARVGTVVVTVNVEEAIVSVGDADVGRTPLAAPLRIGAGRVTIGARAPGYEDQRVEVEVAGGREIPLTFELRRIAQPRGTVRVNAVLEAVRVRVDGEFVGQTPLPAPLSLPPGVHTIEGVRAGYLADSRSVDVREGVETAVVLRLDRDPDATPETLGRIMLRMPRAPSVVRVDGEAVQPEGGMIETPIGPHRLRLEVAERAPIETRVQVAAGETTEISPDFSWSPDARAERLAGASTRRAWGLGTLIAGGGFAVVSGVLFFWSRGVYNSDENEARRDQIAECTQTIPLPQCDGRMGTPDLEVLVEEEQQAADTANTFLYISMAGGAVGIIGLVAGGIMFLGAPTEADVDAEADALEVSLGLGHLGITARF